MKSLTLHNETIFESCPNRQFHADHLRADSDLVPVTLRGASLLGVARNSSRYLVGYTSYTVDTLPDDLKSRIHST